MELLKFFTAGNVDDGKSTLIGRLLYDSGSISTDIIETLTRQSKIKAQNADIDLALLTDGLRAERAQGITIDVAYKYFTTARRKFIIADTPGHIQYTRNMFTGASNANLAIILVDARNGITEQTRRHTIISAILGIPKIVVCVNKLDLVNYSENVFNEIVTDFKVFSHALNIANVSFIPLSALTGENVVKKSNNLQWYEGPALLELLETVPVRASVNEAPRFQVQYVIRPQTKGFEDYRGYAGSVLSGKFKKGDKIVVLPAGIETEILKIEKHHSEIETATAGDPVVIHLKDDIDISRGSTFVSATHLPSFQKELNAIICWMDNDGLQPGQKLILQQNSFQTKAVIKHVESKIDIHTFSEKENDGSVKLNDLFRATLKTAENVSYDRYSLNRSSGAFILINENTNNTVAAGVFN